MNANTITGMLHADAYSVLADCCKTIDDVSYRTTDAGFCDNATAVKSTATQKDKMPNKAKTVLHTKTSDWLYAKIADENGNVASDKWIMRDITDVSIIENNGEKKVVVVSFTDGKKEKAVLCDDDTFTLEQGISVCIAKKLLSDKVGAKHGSSIYNKIIDRAVKIYDKAQQEEQKKIAEEAAKKEKYKKLVAKKQAKRMKREAAERENQIEIQKEAYLRAMREFNTRSAD